MKALENSCNNVSINLGNGEVVFITKQNGKLYGINGICSNLKCILGNLAEDGKYVIRPCHNGTFELDTGKMVKPPFIAPELPMGKYTLNTYNLREAAGFIEIENKIYLLLFFCINLSTLSFVSFSDCRIPKSAAS